MSGYILTFPLSILVIDPQWTNSGEWICDRSARIVTGGLPGGPTCVTFFSDDDLAERYLNQTGISAQIVVLDTPQAASEVARRMKVYHGCSHVVFDPRVSLSPLRVPMLPIDEFISDCDARDNWSSSSDD